MRFCRGAAHQRRVAAPPRGATWIFRGRVAANEAESEPGRVAAAATRVHGDWACVPELLFHRNGAVARLNALRSKTGLDDDAVAWDVDCARGTDAFREAEKRLADADAAALAAGEKRDAARRAHVALRTFAARSFRRRVAATPRPRRGYSVEMSRTPQVQKSSVRLDGGVEVFR